MNQPQLGNPYLVYYCQTTLIGEEAFDLSKSAKVASPPLGPTLVPLNKETSILL